MKVLFALLFASNVFAAQFPMGPNQNETPGSLCATPDSFYYPEHVPHCQRDVDPSLKDQIIKKYDQNFGYSIEQMDRMDFKIDHYIPLCVGGSNEENNLWPQHKSVYGITDPLEQVLCTKMSEGKVLQKDAIQIIKTGKNNLSEVPDIIAHLNSL